MAGMQIINAVRMLQARGTPVHCVAPMMAASMAFQIFAECDRRYALAYSLLLFHPPRIYAQRAVITTKMALQLAKDLRMYEKALLDVLLAKLTMDRKKFYFHFHAETLWPAHVLAEASPGFVEIVDNIEGVKRPFTMR